jgi:hypothetical protein
MAHGYDVLTALTYAYGSPARAQAAFERALNRAGLDAAPTAPDELAAFLRAHVRAIAEMDLGEMVAAVLMQHLVEVNGPEPEAPSSSRPRPLARLRGGSPTSGQEPELPRIMLVRVDPIQGEALLGLSTLAVAVIRVKHPLPARERMRILRPTVVVVGPTVLDRDVEMLAETARRTGSEVIEMGAFIGPAAVHRAIRSAMARAGSALADTEPPKTRRS